MNIVQYLEELEPYSNVYAETCNLILVWHKNFLLLNCNATCNREPIADYQRGNQKP